MRLKIIVRSASLTAIALLVAGCQIERYRLVLSPAGDQLQRELTVWAEPYLDSTDIEYEPFPQAKLDRFGAIYATSGPETGTGKQVFSGLFGARQPGELGGAGWYLRDKTEMGAVTAYAERFAGDDRISAGLDAQRLALDRAVDLWLSWLESEFSQDPDFPAIHSLFDDLVRNDLHDILVYLWSADMLGLAAAATDSGAVDEYAIQTMVRLLLYIGERGYFDAYESESLLRILGGLDGAREDLGTRRFLVRCAASRMGLAADAPLPGPLAALRDDWEVYRLSLNEFMTQSPEVQKLAQEWNDEADAKETRVAAHDRPRAMAADNAEIVIPVESGAYVSFGSESVLHQLAESALLDFGLFFDSNFRKLEIELRLTEPPFATNGHVDQGGGIVSWRADIDPAGQFGNRLPALFFAAWSEPARAFQERHFGRTVLEGRDLALYHEWYAMLAASDAKEWDAFVASLQPGDSLRRRIADFCFSDEPECSRGVAARSGTPESVIVEPLSQNAQNILFLLQSSLGD